MACILFLCVSVAPGQTFQAQTNIEPPLLFDPHLLNELSESSEIRQIRFLTESDYPPFQFMRSDGVLAGFNIDLARAICAQIKASCTIQAWRWDKLNEALANGAGDAIIASQKPTATTRMSQIFSVPYYLTPARFVTLKSSSLTVDRPLTLKGKTIGVVAYSAHEAYLQQSFPAAISKGFASLTEAQHALLASQIDAILADGPSLAIWLAEGQAECCTFRGGAFFDSYFFGEGARIALRPDDTGLRTAINTALKKLDADGTLAELTGKYFPVNFY